MKKRILRALCVFISVLFAVITPLGELAGAVSVTQAEAASVKLNKTKASIVAGKTLQLSVSGTSSKVTWSSSNKKVATVSKTGKVTAKKAGKATITAKVGKKTLTCKVTVEKYGLSKSKLSLEQGKTSKLTLLNGTKKVKWSSSDKSVVKVNSKGKTTTVKAVGPGKAVVTASISGKKYKCTVTVNGKKTSDVSKDNDKGGNNGENKDNQTNNDILLSENVTYSETVIKNLDVENNEIVIDNEPSETISRSDGEYVITLPQNESTEEISEGSVFLLPDENGNLSLAVKAKNVSKNGGKVVVEAIEPEISDVFDEIHIDEKQSVNVANFVPNQELVSEVSYEEPLKLQAIEATVPLGYDLVLFISDGKVGEDLSVSGTVRLHAPEIEAKIDASFNIGGDDIREVKLVLHEKTDVHLKVEKDEIFEKKFYLGYFNIPLGDGFSVDVPIFLKIAADGTFEYTYENKIDVGFWYKDRAMQLINENSSSSEISGEINGSITVNPSMQVRWLGYWNYAEQESKKCVHIVKADLDAGAGATASMKLYNDAPYRCTDFSIYALLTLSIDDEYGLGNAIRLLNRLMPMENAIEMEWEILGNTESNPLRKNFHFEDGVKRPDGKCTRGMSIPDSAATFNGHSYMFYDDASGWADAKKKCEERGGYLAVIKNKAEDDFLYSYITSIGKKSAHFGLVCDSKRVWYTVKGVKAEYFNWHTGEPNNEYGIEFYGMYYKDFTDGKWNDSPYRNKAYGYLCEWDALPFEKDRPLISNHSTAVIESNLLVR